MVTTPALRRHLENNARRRTIPMTRFRQLPFATDTTPDTAGTPPLGFVPLLRQRLAGEPRSQARAQCMAINWQGRPLGWLDVESERMILPEPAAVTVLHLQNALSWDAPALELSFLPRDTFERHARHARVLPLRPTLWQIGHDARPANLALAPLSTDSDLQLRRWPDFRILAHRHDDFRICALLVRRAHNVDACAAALELPHTSVQAFFNAAFLSGYGFPVAAAVPQGERVPAERAGLGLARLWREARARWAW